MIDPYFFTLCLGFGGLVLMALSGLGRHHSSGGSHHSSGGHGHGDQGSQAGTHAGCHGHHAGTHTGSHALMAQHGQHAHGSHSHSRGGQTANDLAATALALLSPRVAFTLLMGFGAAGVLLRPLVGTAWLLCLLALASAAAFEFFIVSRLWRFLFQFASEPARLLDSAVREEGRAVTDFDGSGHGLIALQLDGQLRQILGTLCPEERGVGWRVRTGDRLFIRAVNPLRNTCTVSLLP